MDWWEDPGNRVPILPMTRPHAERICDGPDNYCGLHYTANLCHDAKDQLEEADRALEKARAECMERCAKAWKDRRRLARKLAKETS